MPNFKIVFEIELGAPTPLQAAKDIQEWLQNPINNWQYYIQNTETNEIFSVDLDEEDEDAVLPVTNYHPIIEH
jgi:hypothetical protein